MKTLIATVLATAVSGTFAYAADMTNDPAQYRTVTQKAAADYKAAVASCKSMSGAAKTTCVDEAKVAQARANADAVAQYNDNTKARSAARMKLADAEFALAKSKCAGMVSTDKTNCVNNAQSVHLAALADAKADRNVQVAENTGIAPPVAGSTTTTTTDTKSAAVAKCEQIAGKPDTGCLIDNRSATTGTSGTAGTTATTTATPATTVAQKTENAAATAADKTRDAAATVANKTEHAVDTMAAKTEHAADKSGEVVADSVITTKVKADIFKEPELKSMAIHVETEKGVVMLSGFVDSKADAEKAARIAGTVKGVTSVKSALKVK
jgi:hyperosmotically inducible protein